MPISETFFEIADLAKRLGAERIGELPGCWEQRVDSRWWIAVNGKDKETACSHGSAVPPYSAYVEYNGWPAGMIDPYGGVLVAGEGANEDTFIAALRSCQG
jgi:hypothetical protein